MVRKESADTQEYESRHLGDMDVDGIELHFQCGEQFGWMTRTQTHG